VGDSNVTTRTISDAATEGATLWLVISSSSGVQALELPRKSELTIGRESRCDIVIEDDSVSRTHAEIRNGTVRDLGSRNGTRIAGKRLEAGDAVALEVGSVVEIGSALIVVQRTRPTRAKRAVTSPEAERVVLDPTMARAYALAEIIGPSSLNVIVLGETGTGKEVYAEALHAASKRARARLVRINCAMLHGPLLESELFGHEKGAFTGAQATKPGMLEVADGGTVFLDEIGELALETQAKLLRALETGEVTRLGSLASKKIDVRYIAATHRDLVAASKEGTFRSDLYFRLNGFSVTLPPLRRRRTEIVPIALSILERAAAREGVATPSLAPESAHLLEAHAWPGNVRELRNVAERALVLLRGGTVVLPEHLLLSEAEQEPEVEAPVGNRSTVAEILRDKDRIADALSRCGGNQTLAAKMLGVSRRALINRIVEFGLERPRKR
jgi:transcriptional regulator with PAS, ATPase and Fis domain